MVIVWPPSLLKTDVRLCASYQCLPCTALLDPFFCMIVCPSLGYRLVTTCCGGRLSMKWFRPVRSTGPASWLTLPYSRGCWPESSSRSMMSPWAGAGASSSLPRGKKSILTILKIVSLWLFSMKKNIYSFLKIFSPWFFWWFTKVNCYYLNKRINLKFLYWQKLEKLLSLSLSLKWPAF